jgi:hypothetical protein
MTLVRQNALPASPDRARIIFDRQTAIDAAPDGRDDSCDAQNREVRVQRHALLKDEKRSVFRKIRPDSPRSRGND